LDYSLEVDLYALLNILGYILKHFLNFLVIILILSIILPSFSIIPLNALKDSEDIFPIPGNDNSFGSLSRMLAMEDEIGDDETGITDDEEIDASDDETGITDDEEIDASDDETGITDDEEIDASDDETGTN